MAPSTRVLSLLASLLCGTVAAAAADSRAWVDDDGRLRIAFEVPRPRAAKRSTPGGIFSSLSVPGEGHSHEIGLPQLPVLSRLLAVPDGARLSVQVNIVREEEVALAELGADAPIQPAQPPRPKSDAPGAATFHWRKSPYRQDAFRAPFDGAMVERIGALRGVGLAVLRFCPVRYNPVSGRVRLARAVEIAVTPLAETKGPLAPTFARIPPLNWPFFGPALNRLANPPTVPSAKGEHVDLTRHPVTYLVVANDALRGQSDLDRFLGWKRQKGFRVLEHYVPSGEPPAAIDLWIEDQYAAVSPPPTFLLLVGDESGPYAVSTESPPSLDPSGEVTCSDLRYRVIGPLAATNRIPSLHGGRLSIRSTADLAAQVAKILWYERDQFAAPFTDLSYLARPMGVAGHDTEFAASHCNPQISYGWTYYFNAEHGMPDALCYLYPDSDNRRADILAAFSRGVALYNYTAHGYRFGFSDPLFNLNDIRGLGNDGRYPFVIGNSCLTGAFAEETCFAEALLRAPSSGAVGYIGASAGTLWDEDLVMAVGTIEAVDRTPPPFTPGQPGLIDAMMNGDYPSQGAVLFAGLLAVEDYGRSASRYWSSYHLFGDPSLPVFLGVPRPMPIDAPAALPVGRQTLRIGAPAGALVALYGRRPELSAAVPAGADGLADLAFDASDAGEVLLTVTHPSYRTCQQTIPVVAPNVRWLMVSPPAVSVEAAAGTDAAPAPLACRSSGPALLSYTATPDVPWLRVQPSSGTSTGETDIVTLHFVSAVLPAGIHTGSVRFVSPESDNRERRTPVTLDIRGPALSLRAEPLVRVIEQAQVATDGELLLRNTGRGTLRYSVTSDVPWAAAVPSGGESTGETDRVAIRFASAQLTTGVHRATVTLRTNAPGDAPHALPVNVTVLAPFAPAVEWTGPPFVHDSASPWAARTDVTHDGADAGRSGTVGHGGQSAFSVTVDGPGLVSFWWKTSSEADRDELRFRRFGRTLGTLSGERDWTEVSAAVPTGRQVLSWAYVKDLAVSSGQDCGWVDQILWQPLRQPYMRATPAALDLSVCQGNSATGRVEIANLGPGAFTYRAAASPSWLYVTPATGTVSTVAARSVTVSAPVLSATQEQYAATLTLTAAGALNSPLRVPVSVRLYPSVAAGLDAENLDIRGPMGPAWFTQTAVTHDGIDAARSGGIGHGERSGVQVAATGPAVLDFWWRVSSETDYDWLSLYTNGAPCLRISGETDWTHVQVPLPPGTGAVAWVYEKDPSSTGGSDCGWVDEVRMSPLSPLDAALDASGLTLRGAGSAPWFGQSRVAHDGQDAARSGIIQDLQNSSFRVSATSDAPVLVGFWWRTSCEERYDHLSFYTNGALCARITGKTDWSYLERLFPAGNVEFSWTYQKDGSGSDGDDCGWVDELNVTVIRRAYLRASSPTVQVHYTRGTPLSQGAFTLGSHDGSACDFRIASAATWLSCDPASGVCTNPASSILVLCDPLRLADGVYESEFIVTSDRADNSPIRVAVTIEIAPPLAEAVGQPTWSFGRAGEKPWRGTVRTAHNSGSCARSGAIRNGQCSELAAALSGPGSVRFWWRTSSEENCDVLSFHDGTNRVAILSGSTEWRPVVYGVGLGSHSLRWVYAKDDSVSRGEDCGWVDSILWTPTPPVGPRLACAPPALSVASPLGRARTTTFTVRNLGIGVLRWQVSTDAPWAVADPSSGTGTGQTEIVQIDCRVGELPAGTHAATARVTAAGAEGSPVDIPLTLTVLPVVSVAEALDVGAANPIGFGPVPWYGQTLAAHDGADSARSGPVEQGNDSRMEIPVPGETTLRFWWRISSEPRSDRLKFLLDGQPMEQISGQMDWREFAADLGQGLHTGRWVYARNSVNGANEDAGWVDQVAWTRRFGPWQTAVGISGRWWWLDWFGFFTDEFAPWIYHAEHGWQFPLGETPASVFLWDHGMQTFLWTSRDVYPFLYQFADAAWLWYSPGTRAPRWFFNVRTQQWQPQD